MSTTQDWTPSEALDTRLGQPDRLQFPDDWEYSQSWERAQTERDRGGPINDAERMVYLEGSEQPHRAVFALKGQTLHAECDCASGRFRGFCAHLASLWWQWIRGRIVVNHLDTGREYNVPPSWLVLEPDEELTAELFTPAELDAYLACDCGECGVREYASFTDRSPGTIGNLLGRAREKIPDEVEK